MIKQCFLFLAAVAASVTLYGQDLKAVFEGDKLVWYGLDFTNAKMIGMPDISASEIKMELFREWNYVILDQPEKFTLEKFFRKGSVYKNPEVISKLNETVNANDIKSYNENEITKAEIEAMVKKYKGGDKSEGVGLVFIVENFNKVAETASVYVTYFDIATKKVLLSKKVIGKPRGGGTRNYWAGALYDIMVKVYEREYDNWRKLVD